MIAFAPSITIETTRPKKANGQSLPDVAAFYTKPKRARMSYDNARTGTDLDNHWAFADSYDGDCANSRAVRHRLMHRSRYEAGSNGYYKGIIRSQVALCVGTGPKLRMMTSNRAFNQTVEKAWAKWCEEVQLNRKLRCMDYARVADGEVFALIQNNPMLPDVQLDFQPIEAEQVQTPFLPTSDARYIDGIRLDEFNNVEWYDVLPNHPGSPLGYSLQQPMRVAPVNVIHWCRLERPGTHRSEPDMTSTLGVGATSRRHREATVAAAETAADIGAMLTTTMPPPGSEEAEPVAPFSEVPFAKRQIMVAPMGWDAKQMKGEHPNAQYAEFHRINVSELARPIAMPYNAAACDSSTYSFASGKLDTICHRASLDIERQDCETLVLDKLFAAWFREWTFLTGEPFTPIHQWDWPKHAAIDPVAEENARDTKLKNGTLTLRQAYSDDGKDYEDELVVMAEDWFGDSSEESIGKARQINLLRNVPQAAMQYVAAVLGVQITSPAGASNEPAPAQA